MHWADKIAEEIIASGKYKPYWVDDMKTPSGFAHIGSILGPVIHSSVYRSLKDAGQDGIFTFVINDFDHADSMSEELREKGYEKYMGMSLKMIPSPDPKFESLADYFKEDFITSIRSLGVEAKIVSSWDLYHQGKFDEVVRLALDNSEKIQDIYQKVSGSAKKEAGWLPFQVICEKCGKLGTTRVYNWDGKEVSYKCEPDMVTWAKGCGHEGKISPFGGNGKLPWKVDWAAHWKVIGVTIEGAGKDHASAGGSYDIAMQICKEVFDYPMPYKLPYEFILIGGKKMSSSKGIGLKAHDLVKILPAEVARFLFISSDIKSQSNFDPVGTMAIPDLFDAYDEAWEAYDKNGDEKLARTYVLSQITKVPEKEKGFFAPRFRDIANYLSQGLTEQEVLEKLTETKGGKIDENELNVVSERMKYAKHWLENYAPDEYKFDMTEGIPESAKKLSSQQKKYLAKIIPVIEEKTDSAGLQVSLYELSKSIGIPTKDAFSAIYLSLIGKTHGPRAGVLILNLGANKVVQRLNSIVGDTKINARTSEVNAKTSSDDLNGYSISDKVKDVFPGVSYAYVILKGLSIKKTDPELERLKEEIVSFRKDLTTEKINEIKPIQAYRQMMKKTGVDYHSKRPSPDALLRRISQGKNLYTINTAVDAYNLAVIKTGIGLGGFDLSKIVEPITLRFSKKDEEVFLLGDEEKSFTNEWELVYSDREKVLTIDLNYRDINETKITEETKDVILFADGGSGINPEDVKNTLKLGAGYIVQFCGGEIGEIKLVQ